MSNYNKNDDFFTSEYDKIANNQSQRQSHVDVDGWYSYNNNSNPNKTPKKNIAVVVVSILLILAFIGGFLFSTLFKDPDPIEVPTNEILNEVIRHIEEEWLYSNDITNADWMNMVEQAGTAMLQTVDRYAQLISPQSKYDSENASITESNNSRGYFGFGYQYATFGLYIATVYADSNCYGKLQEGDLIVAFSNAYDYYGNKYEFAVTDLPQAQLINLMGTLQRCTASVLRGGEIVKVNLQRASIGNGNDEFATIEYYFGSNNTNMSTTPQNGAAISSVEARGLERLPSNVGYVRLTSFEYNVSDKEFKQVLNKFRLSGKTKLIVDLKGNPGGTVITAANIAGLLSKPATNQDFVACTLVDNAGNDEKYRPQTDYRKYDDYFGEQDGNTKDIVIWTDGNSASASEILTGALLDYGSAIQMGTTSFGKGIAQYEKRLSFTGEVINVWGERTTGYWYIYFTVSYWFSPNQAAKPLEQRECIHGVGYTPTAAYNNLSTYSQLVDAVIGYWG